MRSDHTRTSTANQDHDLHLRIQAEFVEMPGLKLTLSQASRLFDLDRTQCERVLSTLVERRVLWQCGAMFARPASK
jgi:hypothetical protein